MLHEYECTNMYLTATTKRADLLAETLHIHFVNMCYHYLHRRVLLTVNQCEEAICSVAAHLSADECLHL